MVNIDQYGHYRGMDQADGKNILTPEMCRAARAFLNWTQADLAEHATVSRGTVRDYESSRHGVHRATISLLRRALDDGGAPLVDLEGGGLALLQKVGE